jgi:hypothetical protein
MESCVEYGYGWSCLSDAPPDRPNYGDGRRVVQWRDLFHRFDSGDDFIVNPHGIEIGFAAMNYTVSDDVNSFCTCDCVRAHLSSIHPGEYRVGSLPVISRREILLRNSLALV